MQVLQQYNDESLRHLFVQCLFVSKFWDQVWDQVLNWIYGTGIANLGKFDNESICILQRLLAKYCIKMCTS